MAKRSPNRHKEAVEALQATTLGQERNMYPYIRQIFMEALGYQAGAIKVDTALSNRAIPDLAVYVDGPVGGAKAKKTLWMVVEAKDEPGAFLNGVTRETIFKEKAKYIDLDTAFFVMIDPGTLVIRKIVSRSSNHDPKADTVLAWADLLDEAVFKAKTQIISSVLAGTSPRLEAFRAGSAEHISSISLKAGDNLTEAQLKDVDRRRNEFFASMKQSASLLKAACVSALRSIIPEIDEIRTKLDTFRTDYNGVELHLEPFRLKGKSIDSPEKARKHNGDVRALRNLLGRNLPVSRLAVFAYGEYLERSKKNGKPDIEKLIDLLAAETASLMLARIVMLRFFEDRDFFGTKRYLCNGGVAAFQQVRAYFEKSYSHLLQQAYSAGASIFAAVFAETEYDWFMGARDPSLSAAIERSMFYLSFFNFATVQQDVLSEIYGQFLESEERKERGEHYTPPDVARYIVERLKIGREAIVMDPACGLGTFLIESYDQMIGTLVNRGAGTFEDAVSALARIRGNDLNVFSAMIARIQVIWQLFPFDKELKARGFPDLLISGGANSLAIQGLDLNEIPTDFGAIDAREYDFVIGNPPYVRVERQSSGFEKYEEEFYERDIPAKSDLYSLFIYRAMESWLKKQTDTTAAGRLGFVLPISFCDNDGNAALRRLFAPGGRWRITEIVDLELIGPLVFGADVVPIIFLAENRPAEDGDEITIRWADENCATFTGHDEKHLKFNLEKCVATTLSYGSVFSSDGRIHTRMTARRLEILEKINAFPTLMDASERFWTGKKGSKIDQWGASKPKGASPLKWEEVALIRGGAAFRGSGGSESEASAQGLPVFKGENVVSCAIQGDPVKTNVDYTKMDDASVWRFSDILPKYGYAFHQISTGLTAARFSPSEMIWLNTVSLFFPRASLQDVPFDIIVSSRIYQFVFAVAHREGVMFRARCHIYPSTLGRLPWSDDLVAQADVLSEIRERFLSACKEVYQWREVQMEKAAKLESESFQDAVGGSADCTIEWSEDLLDGGKVKLVSATVDAKGNAWYVRLGDELFSWMLISDKAIAHRLVLALRLHDGEEIGRDELLALFIPTTQSAQAWEVLVRGLPGEGRDPISKVLDEVDLIVGKAFGLDDGDVAFIQTEMTHDPMLRRVKPNRPFMDRKLKGLRLGLESPDRYNRAYRTRS